MVEKRRAARVISIQSHVADGHVGNSSAVFPMQRLGVEVVPVHTLQFSNHPGHGAFRGRVFEAAHVAEVLEGLAARGTLDSCDAILTGYLGSAEIAEVVAGFVVRAKQVNAALIYACDPVIGDRGKGVYVRPELAAAIRDRLVPLADVLFPNQFELEFLTGRVLSGRSDLNAAVQALRAIGPGIIAVTSVQTPVQGAGHIANVITLGDQTLWLETELLGQHFSGVGDCFAAVFLSHWLRTGDILMTFTQTVTTIEKLLAKTVGRKRQELALVEGQSAFRIHRIAIEHST